MFMLLLVASCGAQAAGKSLIQWLDSDQQAFRLAREQNKPVLLYLEAVWCHWCHVIDQQTYGDPAVARLVNDSFIPLRIDQDSRPDLANRYRDYGWPATIFFTPDGIDMVKRQGFIAPEPFARLLQAIIDDPSPEAAAALVQGEAATASSDLPDDLRSELLRRHLARHDPILGGLNKGTKSLDRDSVEYDLVLAADGDSDAGIRARRTLDGALALIDPVWGGVYQYSTFQDWKHPHFEKLTTIQGEYLRIYALAWAQFSDPRYLQAAHSIQGYIATFLTDSSGGFYASQDSDLVQGQKASGYFALDNEQRRALGVPKVDTQLYARETGSVIEALATLYEFERDPKILATLHQAASWASTARGLGKGGFRHGEIDSAGPYLGDSLAMGRAFLALYKATANRSWLQQASDAADFIDANFRYPTGGFASAVAAGAVIQPVPQIDENISTARFVNLLGQIQGSERHQAMGKQAMLYLSQQGVAARRITEPGILLVDHELNHDPLHLTVIGSKDDPVARQLFQATLDQPGWYKRAEWWDQSEGKLPNPDVSYPPLKRPAAFVCTDNRCSLPIYQPSGVAAFLALD